MFLVQITFGSDGGDRRHRELLKRAAEDYLSALSWNGQVCGECLLTWSNAQLIAYNGGVERASLQRRPRTTARENQQGGVLWRVVQRGASQFYCAAAHVIK